MSRWEPYCGAAPMPDGWLGLWNFDPWLIGTLLFGLAAGWRTCMPQPRGLLIAAFALMTLLFVSPLCRLSSALFSVRAGHHLLLVAAVAPLLAFSLPIRAAGSLIMAAAVHVAMFWVWHAPGAYSFALSHDAAFWAMQLSLLGSAVWYWAAVRLAHPAAAAASALGVMVSMGLLGALITFAGAPLYAPHLISTYAWGMTPLQDQQLAGLIMWAPGSLAYLAATMVVMGRWLSTTTAPGVVRP